MRSSAQAPRSVTSSPVPPFSMTVSWPVAAEAAARGLVTDGVEPRVAERRHGPDKGDVADVERGNQVGDGPAQGASGCADGTEGPFVAVGRLRREGLQ